MPNSYYQIVPVQPEWVLESEALGSKEKFWYSSNADHPEWLFKYPQANTGQHWAEKIAAEIAQLLGIQHARVELAVYNHIQGSVTESFARDGRNLFHGNQILAGRVLGYDPARKFRQSDHTLENIFTAINRTFLQPATAQRTKTDFAGYVVFDALIGNTDRHHENWGLLRRRIGNHWQSRLAPTFDHASSLGRELLDEGGKKSRTQLMQDRRIGRYAESAHGAIFWDKSDKRGISPLELVRKAAVKYPQHFDSALAAITRIDRTSLEEIIEKIPRDWMSDLARRFAVDLVCYNKNELQKIKND